MPMRRPEPRQKAAEAQNEAAVFHSTQGTKVHVPSAGHSDSRWHEWHDHWKSHHQVLVEKRSKFEAVVIFATS